MTIAEKIVSTYNEAKLLLEVAADEQPSHTRTTAVNLAGYVLQDLVLLSKLYGTELE